jgi:hypothetical protein
MTPSKHIIMSIPLGTTIAWLTHSISAGLLCFLSGVLVDVDHIFDYIINFKLKSFNIFNIFNIKQIYHTYIHLESTAKEGKIKKLYLMFHSIEFVLLLYASFLFTKNKYLLAIALGLAGHLAMDIMTNRLKPHAYFLSSRMAERFNAPKLIKRQ